MEKYNPKQIEEIAGMLLTYETYLANKDDPSGILLGLLGIAKGHYETMTPLRIRNKIEEIRQNHDKIAELVGDKLRINRHLSE